MKTVLKIEEAAMFALSLILFTKLELSWWWFAGCILLPDLSMIGYMVNPKAGAWSYNLFHHKALAIIVGIAGVYLGNTWIEFTGVILFAHAALDRILGYGLKYEEGFQSTHLGAVGKAQPQS